MKDNKFLTVISVLSLIFIVLGATFSFFSTVSGSEDGAVAGRSAVMGINLSVTPEFVVDNLIPLNDSDVETAYLNECIDTLGNSACQSYTIGIENIGDVREYFGTINFTLTHIQNLRYMVLDENNQVYFNPQNNIVSGDDLSLGDEFELQSTESKTFKLIIWLSNTDYPQDDEDSSGHFNATVTYESSSGYRVTGTISG